MNDRERILDKIKKCLTLAKSGNEHEAAAALRQARALMASHGISEAEMLAIGVSEKRVRAGAVDTPPKWESDLAGHIALAFGCRLLFVREDWYTATWSFIGMSPSNDVAHYAFEVLFRQVKRAREQHIKAALKRYKRSNKTRLADLFCEGWVRAALQAIVPITNSEATKEALDAYLQLHHPKTGSLDIRNRNAGRQLSDREWDSWNAGRTNGREAELHQGVGAAPAPLMLEE